MERSSPPAGRRPPNDGDQIPRVRAAGRRQIIDLLPDSFVLERSEAEWLMTLLGADELAYIFGDDGGGEAQD